MRLNAKRLSFNEMALVFIVFSFHVFFSSLNVFDLHVVLYFFFDSILPRLVMHGVTSLLILLLHIHLSLFTAALPHLLPRFNPFALHCISPGKIYTLSSISNPSIFSLHLFLTSQISDILLQLSRFETRALVLVLIWLPV